MVFALAPWFYFLVSEVWHLVLLRFFHGMATAIFTPVALAAVADLFPTRRGEAIGWYSSLRQSGTMIGRMGSGVLIDTMGFVAVFAVCGGLGVAMMALLFFSADGRQHDTTDEQVTWRELWKGLIGIARHPVIVATSLMQGLLMLADGMLMAFLPLYGISVGLTPTEVGMLFGLQGIVSIVARPVMGRQSDRIGRPPLIVAGLCTCAVAICLFPVMQSFAVLLIPAILFGVGSAIVASATSAYVADLTPPQSLGSAMGVFGMLMDIGHAGGPIIGGLLIGLFGGVFHPAFWIIAALLLLGVVLFLIMKQPPRAPATAG